MMHTIRIVFDAFFAAGILYWFIYLPLGLVIGYIMLFKTTHWSLRLLTAIGTVLFMLPVIYAGMLFLSVSLSPAQRMARKIQREQRIKAHTWVLDQSTKIADITLPEGTTVYLDLDFHMQQKKQAELRNIDSLHLSAPTNIFGLSFKDHFYNYYPNWSGTLKGNQIINGWPCFSEITFERDSLDNNIKLRKWTLSEAHKAFGQLLPKDTYIEHTKPFSTYIWTFYLPDGTFMRYNPNDKTMSASHKSAN